MEKNKNIYIEAITNALITAIVTAIFSFILGFFSLEKVEIVISNSKKGENYISIIEIENYKSDLTVENSNIILEDDIEIININTNLEENTEDNKINIKSIYPKSTESILIETNKEINSDNVIFQIPVKHRIRWVSEEQFAVNNFLSNILITGIVCAVITCISNVIMYTFTQREFNLKNQEVARIEKEEVNINKKLTDIENKLNTYEKYSKYLLNKLADYAKELEFWKDTIRKAFYNKKNIKTSDDLFGLVTKNLKTFKTLKKCDSYDLQFILREYEKNNNK